MNPESETITCNLITDEIFIAKDEAGNDIDNDITGCHDVRRTI